jgi:putative hemin transport protein
MTLLNTIFETASNKAQLPLKKRFDALMQDQPQLRRRDAAEQLGVGEALLLEAQCGLRSVRLKNRFAQIITEFPRLGYIMTLTRNASAVHERKGVYDNVSINGPMGLVITPDRKIDLRIIISRWASGFAVVEETQKGARYSLQFFDQAGVAVQKIYLQPESDLNAYQTLVDEHCYIDSPALSLNHGVEVPDYADDSAVNKAALIKDWQDMRNVHQFFGLLKNHKVSRLQSFKIAGAPLAQEFDANRLEPLLHDIAATDLSIMCFVGNRGNIQIHTGPINRVKTLGPWLNILDPEFNLHLLTDNIASAWLIRKPSAEGDITSLELYDNEGETIAQFFGQREEGNPENHVWRNFAESLLETAAVA